MSNLKRSLTRAGNRLGVWMYRTLDGRLSSGSKDVHVLLITTPGRRTGIMRSTCVRYLESVGGFVVWGTGRAALVNRTGSATCGTQRWPTCRSWPGTCRSAEGSGGPEREAMWNDVCMVSGRAGSREDARAKGRTNDPGCRSPGPTGRDLM